MRADPLAYTPLLVALTLLLNAFFPLLKSAPPHPHFPTIETLR
jgi:hypothetical protein